MTATLKAKVSKSVKDAIDWAGNRFERQTIAALEGEYAEERGIALEAAHSRMVKATKVLEREGMLINRPKWKRFLPRYEPQILDWVQSRAHRLEIDKEILGLCPCMGLTLNDLHIPHTNWKAVNKCVERFQDAKFVVINGDGINAGNVGKFHNKKELSLKEQVKVLRDFVVELRKVIGKIYLSLGNHEDWFFKLLNELSKANPATEEALDYLKDILECDLSIASLEAGRKMQATAGYGNMLKAGDCVVSHPPCFSAASGVTAQWVKDHLVNYHQEYGVTGYSTIITGHTHFVYDAWVNQIHLIEGGTLSGTQDFQFKKIQAANKKNRWTTACAYVTLDRAGHVEHNATGYWLAE